MVKEFQPVSLFKLSSNNIQVTYSSSGMEGSSLPSYRDRGLNCQSRGRNPLRKDVFPTELHT